MQPTFKAEPSTWKLGEVLSQGGYKSLPEVVAGLEGKTKELEGLRPSLAGADRKSLRTLLKIYSEIQDMLQRVGTLSYMEFSVATTDEQKKAALDRAEELRASVENRTLFLRLWWTGLPIAKARDLRQPDPDLRYFLETWRQLSKYTLDEKVEQAVNIKNTTGASAWVHHYDQLTSSFSFRLKVGGVEVKGARGKPKTFLTGEVIRQFSSADPTMREAAYRSLLAKFGENGSVLGEVYRTIVRDWRNENLKMRGYSRPISARNLENHVPDQAVETLLASCRKHAEVFQEFFRTKARLLGMKRMSRYHIYAPLGDKNRNVRYGEAFAMVMNSFRSFDPKFAELALNVFERGHVDSDPRQGKMSGAYCMSVTPGVVPFLLLNYTGSMRDVYTIAHESGHAVHDQLASYHSVLTFQPPLVLAETASVFGEMILFDRFLAEEKDPDVKRGVLLDKVTAMYSSIGRQAYFTIFEEDAHSAVDEGATSTDLCGKYVQNLDEQFGSAVAVPEEFKWEWTYIPHIFHTPFYCYAYAFGNLLSLALYDRYTKEGRSFVPSYMKVLSYGGSESPTKVLEEVGVDVRSAQFWRGGFDVIRRMTRELQKL